MHITRRHSMIMCKNVGRYQVGNSVWLAAYSYCRKAGTKVARGRESKSMGRANTYETCIDTSWDSLCVSIMHECSYACAVGPWTRVVACSAVCGWFLARCSLSHSSGRWYHITHGPKHITHVYVHKAQLLTTHTALRQHAQTVPYRSRIHGSCLLLSQHYRREGTLAFSLCDHNVRNILLQL